MLKKSMLKKSTPKISIMLTAAIAVLSGGFAQAADDPYEDKYPTPKKAYDQTRRVKLDRPYEVGKPGKTNYKPKETTKYFPPRPHDLARQTEARLHRRTKARMDIQRSICDQQSAHGREPLRTARCRMVDSDSESSTSSRSTDLEHEYAVLAKQAQTMGAQMTLDAICAHKLARNFRETPQ